MKVSFALFVAAGLLAISSAAAVRPFSCRSKCRFVFCDKSDATLDVKGTRSDVALTGPICARRRRHTSIGVVNTGEALVVNGPRRLVPISKVDNGLKQPFAQTLFKSYTIRGDKKRRRPSRSGIGHQVFQKGEEHAVRGLCIIIPIRQYQVYKRNNVVRNVNSRSPLRDCIALYVR